MHDYQRVDFLLRLLDTFDRTGRPSKRIIRALNWELGIEEPTTKAELQEEVSRAIGAVYAYREKV